MIITEKKRWLEKSDGWHSRFSKILELIAD